MGTERFPETLCFISDLTRLTAREEFIAICRRESFKSQTGISLTDFTQKPQIFNFIKLRLLGAELFHSDGQTNMTKLIATFRNFVNACKNVPLEFKF